MSRGDLPAAPTQWSAVVPTTGTGYMTGLTIREHFAGLAMQGVLANSHSYVRTMDYLPVAQALIAEVAVSQADALLAELAKTVTP